jgi:hypothetical protein
MVKVEKLNDIHSLRVDYIRNSKWEKWVLLVSDVHFDSVKCDRKLFKKHLDEAKEKDATVLIFGDFFDCMQGRFDPRSGKGDLRPEYNVKGYFDVIVKDAVKFLEPYKDNVRFISDGNHELSILSRQEVDLLGNLTDRLDCERGNYNGFIKFMFESTNKKNNKSGGRSSTLLYYTHGSGGNSPVTRGVIKTNRRNATIQSDIFVSGHIHSEWVVNLPMVRVTDQGVIKKTEQTHISLGTYKDDSFSNSSWADTKEFPPPSMGGCWLRFYYDRNENTMEYETIRAK